MLLVFSICEALQIFWNKLHSDSTMSGQFEAITELLEVCLKTTCFQVDEKVFQQKDGMAMGSSLFAIVSDSFKQFL